MSDADDQLGGTGGERGRKPSEPRPGADDKPKMPSKDGSVDRDSKDSFPASDPAPHP